VRGFLCARGQTGGLSAYAERVGRTKQFVSQLVAAAEVAKQSSQLDGLDKRTQHLSHVHALPESAWQPMVDWIIDNSATVAQTKDRSSGAYIVLTRLDGLKRLAA
jgi:hypothetical protein